MLDVVRAKSREITKVTREKDCLVLCSEDGVLRLTVKTPGTVRVTYQKREPVLVTEKPGVVFTGTCSDWSFTEEQDMISLCTEKLRVDVNRRMGSLRYFDREGCLLLAEREKESRTMEEFPVYAPAGDTMRVEKVVTPDGTKDVVREASKEQIGTLYHTRVHFDWQEAEALYGLGQYEEGHLNLRGKTVYGHQANRKIAVPVLVSTLGYGILFDTYSPFIFQDTEYGSYFYGEAEEEIDYYFMAGGCMDGVIKEYRQLTGKAAMLPKWMYGYLQSQERYETEAEILAVAKEYRDREIGLDCIILDWFSWGDNQWGQKGFDGSRFPNPSGMTETLHENFIRFMISIWPNMAECTDNYKEFMAHGLMLPGCTVYNALSAEGRKLYWEQTERALFCHGIDAWWCDSSEPFTPDWNHREVMEPAKLYEEYCRTVAYHLPADKGNAYGLYHAMGIYEGQRGSVYGKEKRVANLTRSGYTGQQRYGAVLWSGDIAASWDTYRKQIAAGLNFCATGIPYWTVDIGAFFVKEGGLWYWKGEYSDTTEDLGYRELFVRWYQWGSFLPVFRGHGTDCRRELWKFGDTGEPFYEALLAANRLRYELMPYLYSLAGAVWRDDASIMRLLAFDFPEDTKVWDCKNQYMFGKNLMVCPVTTPMYYERNSVKLTGVPETREVYLPAGTGWYDYYTKEYFEGGQTIVCDAPLDRIPLFVREGSILPKAAAARSTAEQSDALTMEVCGGCDGEFVLYEDAGDGYGYETGEYQCVTLVWKDAEKKLYGTNAEAFAGRNITTLVFDK